MLFVTERAVFRIGEAGLELIEIAPGIDAERDVIAHMGFRPAVARDLAIDGPAHLRPRADAARRRRPAQAARLPLGARRAWHERWHEAAQGRRNGMSIRIDGATRLFAIVGDPIAQVRSATVFSDAFAARGNNAVMVPVQIAPDRFDAVFPALMALGNLDGLLVTVPYKARALPFASRLGTNAKIVGAVNALRREPDGTWSGDMFDGVGFVRAAERKGERIRGPPGGDVRRGRGGQRDRLRAGRGRGGVDRHRRSDARARRRAGRASCTRRSPPAASPPSRARRTTSTWW